MIILSARLASMPPSAVAAAKASVVNGAGVNYLFKMMTFVFQMFCISNAESCISKMTTLGRPDMSREEALHEEDYRFQVRFYIYKKSRFCVFI